MIPTNSAEFARMKREEPVQKRKPTPPPKSRLIDFPPMLRDLAEKLSAWVEPELRPVVMLAYCRYWENLTQTPPIQPPGGEEYEAFKLILKLSLAPNTYGCPVCGWPRAEGYHCFACGDLTEEG